MAFKCANCGKAYQQPTADYFCTTCGYDGLLVDDSIEGSISPENKGTQREVGLCILLMDASGSMTDPAFKGSPVTKMKLVANSAAQGIFELQQMGKVEDAYICGIKFDHRVEQMFFCTVKDLLEKFNYDSKSFADYLYGELSAMEGTTDINGALQAANSFADSFMNKTIANFQDYTPMEHVIFTKQGQSKTIPNIRVLIYTDGMQVMNGATSPLSNPFKSWDTDILMGAFFGESDQQGFNELRGILSKCPNHDFEQFFLLDNPKKIATLRKLFRMASGASGFCPLCIPKE